MMQAWKYSLPAFLVPFMFATSPLGANLLIVGATWPGFILATINSSASLVFLSLGIVGYVGQHCIPWRGGFSSRPPS